MKVPFGIVQQRIVLTDEGIFDLNDQNLVITPFANNSVHQGERKDNEIAVIVNRNEIWKKNREWVKVATSKLKLNCLSWWANQIIVGTESARIAKIVDNELEFDSNFDAIESRNSWNTPWGGLPDVRSLVVSPSGIIYANIHVGWICRSIDSGKTWMNITNGLDKDVHQIAVHRNNESVVLAATADGFHISLDNGSTFQQKWKGIRLFYQRAVSSFPNSDVILVSVSRGPNGSNSKLFRSDNYGDSWAEVYGLPDKIKLNINTYQISTFENGHSYLIVEAKDVYQSKDFGLNWDLVMEDLPKAYQVL